MTDAEQRYLDIVKHIVKDSRGQIPDEEHVYLDRLRQDLHLSPEAAKEIEQRVLNAYQAFLRRSKPGVSQTAETVSRAAVSPTPTLPPTAIPQTAAEARDLEEAHQAKLRWYEEEYAKAMQEQRLSDRKTQDKLIQLQRDLRLSNEEIVQIEQTVAARKGNPEVYRNFQNGHAASDSITQLPSPELTSGLAPTELQPPRSRLVSQSLLVDLPPDYSELNQLLQAQQWKQADRVTLDLMLKISNRTKSGWLDDIAIAQFPCEALYRLDRLWGHYSQEKFGFRVQSDYYFGVVLPEPNPLNDHNDSYERALAFSKRVGWWRSGAEFYKYYYQLDFTLDAPDGHLPALWLWQIPWWRALRFGGLGSGRGGSSIDERTISTWMQRLQSCEITSSPEA